MSNRTPSTLMSYLRATELVKTLNADPSDDWTYQARPMGNHLYRIDCYDETNTYAGSL